MNLKTIWTNYKIYAFILGVVAGALVYNIISIDFSFYMYEKISINDIWESYIYFLLQNIKFLLIIFVISFFDIRQHVLVAIIFFQAFVLSGLITTIILSGSTICIYSIPSVLIKIASSIFMFNNSKPIINRLISVLIILVGALIENFFVIYF